MKPLKRLHLLVVLILYYFLYLCMAEQAPRTLCGKTHIDQPFSNLNSTEASPLSRMILCRSQKPYLRTSLGLFAISSIDYTNRLLTISHQPSCSSQAHFFFPSLLTAGFPLPPHPNSLLLLDCSDTRLTMMSTPIHNCTDFHTCQVLPETPGQSHKPLDSCLLVHDLEKLENGIDPKALNCSGSRWVYKKNATKNGTELEDYKGYELGTRISFDIPDHAPNLCNECERPNGNCGVGLRCICHPKECRDRVISGGGGGASFRSFGCTLFCFLALHLVLFI
ncbi:uncharacterized protein LOC115735563 [Rhodamnia argentea]|uniref:Uncharacterized protein LOC115735563 n=1 Tax=Rhodamnia argentea TaxID=178133 RepID=A0A8B8NJQ7_9MYRT|nr:uncharacterized protein LOC115735563 [Rhodamnia argentea]